MRRSWTSRAGGRGVAAALAALALAGCALGERGDRAATVAASPIGTAGTGGRSTPPAAPAATPSPNLTDEPAAPPRPAFAPPGGPPNVVAEGPDGDVLSSEELPAPAGARAWRVLYRSRSTDGRPIGVSGLVIRPPGPAPAGGFPVLTWGHGTTGAADRCAPSLGEDLPVPELGALLGAGFVVAATDYEGLGTPGPHPYLVGESAGRSLLDAARAAGRLPGTDAAARVLPWGSSQGGHAALFAGQIAPRHAPELELLGVAAASPAADVATLIGGAAGSPLSFGYTLLTLATWTAVYPEAELTSVVTETAAAEAGVVDQVCLGGLIGALAGRSLSELVVADPRDVEPWAELLERNSVGREPVPAPVLVVHGDADPVIPVELSERLLDDLCAGGTAATLRRYPGAGHGEAAIAAGADDVLAWLRDRVAGAPPPSDCTP